jgi:hypothetical protein
MNPMIAITLSNSVSAFRSGGTSALINAVFVSGAGTEDANGLFNPDGTINSRTKYSNAVTGVSFVWNGAEYRIGASGGFGDLYYISTNAPANPWAGIYVTAGDGTEPPPTVRQATTADTP